MAAKLSPGKEVLSLCGKCKLRLAHIIVAMRDSVTIGKVKCKTCGSEHNYKSVLPGATGKSGTKARSRSGKSEAKSSSLIWENEVPHREDQAKTYATNSKFTVGDIINHPIFGFGLVQKQVTNDKIEILFKVDIKTLVHNKQ